MEHGRAESKLVKNLSKFKTYSERRLYLESIVKNQTQNKHMIGKSAENKVLIRNYLHNWYISKGNRIFECTVTIRSGDKPVYTGKCVVVEEPTCLTIEPIFSNSIFEISRSNIINHDKFQSTIRFKCRVRKYIMLKLNYIDNKYTGEAKETIYFT